ncbi:MAG: hypothetical protein RLZZ148_674 [Cyanobacteriota bacterium]
MLDPTLFAAWIKRFCTFYGRTLDADLFDIYYDAVKDIPDIEFQAISKELFKNEQFFPVAGMYAKYRKEAFNTMADANWKQVHDCIKRGIVALNDAKELNPQCLEALEDMGGLWRIAQADERQLPALKKEFVKAFGYSSGLIPLPVMPTPLKLIAKGQSENNNDETALVGLGSVLKNMVKE